MKKLTILLVALCLVVGLSAATPGTAQAQMTFTLLFQEDNNPVLGLTGVTAWWFNGVNWIAVPLAETDDGFYVGSDANAPWPGVLYWKAGFNTPLVWPESPTANPTGSMNVLDDDCFMQWQVDDNRP